MGSACVLRVCVCVKGVREWSVWRGRGGGNFSFQRWRSENDSTPPAIEGLSRCFMVSTSLGHLHERAHWAPVARIIGITSSYNYLSDAEFVHEPTNNLIQRTKYNKPINTINAINNFFLVLFSGIYFLEFCESVRIWFFPTRWLRWVNKVAMMCV